MSAAVMNRRHGLLDAARCAHCYRGDDFLDLQYVVLAVDIDETWSGYLCRRCRSRLNAAVRRMFRRQIEERA